MPTMASGLDVGEGQTTRDRNEERRNGRRDDIRDRYSYDERRDSRRDSSRDRDRNEERRPRDDNRNRYRNEEKRPRYDNRDRDRYEEKPPRDGNIRDSRHGDVRERARGDEGQNVRTPHQDLTGRKLFVAAMSFETTEDSLEKLFASTGSRVVACHIAKDKETGKSRCFGFVTFDSTESAAEAAIEFDGVELDGREIAVHIANEDGNRRDKGDKPVAGYAEDVSISAYKPEKIEPEQQRVALKQSKLPSEMMKNNEDGFGFVYSDDEKDYDPELAFVNSLSANEKRKLLKKMVSDDKHTSKSHKKAKKSKKSKKSSDSEDGRRAKRKR